VDSDGPKEAQVQLYSPGGTNVPDDTAVSCAKMAGPIDLPFVLELGWAEGNISSIVFTAAPRCQRGRARWCHLSVVAMQSYVRLL